ncbi:MAG TPA: glutamate--tRNA ligase [Actinomycetota bacterium]|jgi:glutamyl-tRNA synthetase|nr:glutamate--tRNA ligase [Actinomycetota bacterium]
MSSPVRTRIAPAPSGSIHVGNARTALYNWLFARHHGGVFVLRIEDTDAKRVADEHVAAVLEDLRWLGLEWDEGPEVGGPHGPYRQSERAADYHAAAEKLIADGRAYRDYLTSGEHDELRAKAQSERQPWRFSEWVRERNAERREAHEAEDRPYAIRFLVPQDRTIAFSDVVRGEVATDTRNIGDFIIVRSDGTATYMLAVTIDDLAMDITHVIRGEDLMAATPRQLLLREALGAPQEPVFAHLPLLVDERGRPLSKRWGDVSVGAYRERGYLPEAMVNYLALLGWSYDDRTNVFSVDELIERFSLERVGRNPAAFDVNKLEWLNGHYIREKPPELLADALAPFCEREGIDVSTPDNRATLATVVPLLSERLKRLDEAPGMIRFLFVDDVAPDDKAAAAIEGESDYLRAAADALDAVEEWSAAAVEAALRALAESRGLKPRKAFQPIRAAVTGTLVSPPLFESLEILGRARTVTRLRRFV